MQKTIEVDDLSFWTESFGSDGDDALVLIAGAGATAFFWPATFCEKLAAAGFFVIRYDHRDTGLSTTRDFSEHPYVLQDLVGDVMRVMDGYGIKSAHLVGHSMGGFIAQYLAAYHPAYVKSITCISSAAAGVTKRPPETMSKPERDQMARTWEVMLTNKPTENYEESIPGFLNVWRYLMGEMELDEEMAKVYIEDNYHRTLRKVGPHQEHMTVMQEVAKTVGKRPELMGLVRTKTLVIHGEKDPLVPAERGGKILAEEVKGAELALIPKMGHMLFNHDLEDTLVQIMTEFYNKIKT